MKVVFHHEHPLPVLKYGGIERIIYWHMIELVRQGHQVTLIGHADSKVIEHGIELIPIDMQNKNDWENLIPTDTSIVHLFYNHKVAKFPTINTIQGNGKVGETFKLNTVFVSKKHAENHSSDQFIYNGLDLNEYLFIEREKSWNQFVFLAKASWSVKNLKHTVAACRACNKHLNIVGGRWIGISRYIHSLGMLGGQEKLDAIYKSDALIFPVRWHEPFGIAIIEAMALGLPVIGSPYGSLPEIIRPEVGFIVNNLDELKSVLRNPSRTFSAKEIRKYIEENFTIKIHTEKYIEKYKIVLSGKTLNQNTPKFLSPVRAETLLPF